MGTHVFLEPIGASTILNVYGWIANNFLSLLVDLGLNTSLEAGVLMNAKSYHKKGLFNIEKQTIDINHELMTQKKFCDNIFDIISVLTHERQHLLDAVLFGLKVYESWGGRISRMACIYYSSNL